MDLHLYKKQSHRLRWLPTEDVGLDESGPDTALCDSGVSSNDRLENKLLIFR